MRSFGSQERNPGHVMLSSHGFSIENKIFKNCTSCSASNAHILTLERFTPIYKVINAKLSPRTQRIPNAALWAADRV